MAIKEKTKRRVSKRPEERRLDLLDAAAKVFGKKGIDATTIEDITRAAGVGKGTLYLYFPSKEHLLEALKQRFVGDMWASASSVGDQAGVGDWWALTDALVERMIDFLYDNRDLIRVFTQEWLAKGSELFSAEEELLRSWAGGIQAGIDEGVFGASDPLVIATMIHHAIGGTVEHAVMGQLPMDRDRILAGAKELMRKVLAP